MTIINSSKDQKKIGVITGARSDFGLVEFIIDEIITTDLLDIQLYVTGMHLLGKYGKTSDLILKRNYPNTFLVNMYDEESVSNELGYIGKSISKGIKNMVEIFIRKKPDLILLTGDRVEMMAACIAASSLGIAIAHIHGGDISENAQIDEQIRHSITKFAHIHFTASELSKKRVIQMGEEKWRVFNTGSPEIDYSFKKPLMTKSELLHELKIANLTIQNQYILCVQHPSIYQSEKSGIQMQNILQNLKKMKTDVIIIYPNNDPGNNLIIEEIESVKKDPHFHVFKNLSRRIYLSLMKHAWFMIGNSSSGIIESAIFNLPVLNVGIRNNKRECSQNVFTVSNSKNEIWKGINYIKSDEFNLKCKNLINLYGDGNASLKIVEILKKIPFDDRLYFKKFIFY